MPAMSESHPAVERRRAVRLRPLPELPASALLLGGEEADLDVSDVSVGGLAVMARPALAGLTKGSRHRISLALGRYGAYELEVEVRHRGGDEAGTIGLQLVDPPAEATSALGRYVAELLERGASS